MRKTNHVVITTKKELTKLLQEEIVFPLLPRAEEEWGDKAKLKELGFEGLDREVIMAQIAQNFGITISEKEESAMMCGAKALEDGVWQKYWAAHLMGRADLLAPNGNFTLQQAQRLKNLLVGGKSKHEIGIIFQLDMQDRLGYGADSKLEDLYFDSITMVHIVFELEKISGLEVSDDHFAAIKTYVDLERTFAPQM